MTGLRIAVIGGGRWARIYVRLLAAHAADIASIVVVTPRNVDGMRAWAAAENLPGVEITGAWPEPGRVDAAIVVNAASDHDSAAEKLLRAGIPLLVEKPFAANAAKAGQLVGLAAARGTYLAAAQVFRFAGYLHRFAGALVDISSVSLTWCDPAAEQRYGDAKSHDAALPLVVDIVPHLLSVLDILLPGALLCEGVSIARGGAEVALRLSAGNVPISVRLARNAPRRERLLEVTDRSGRAMLDFATEPGSIAQHGAIGSADPNWRTRPSPLTQLVAAYLAALAGKGRDPRLAAAHGVTACTLADAALRQADAALLDWLKTAPAPSEDLRYAAAEIAARRREPALLDASAEKLAEALEALRAR
jgi:predicted dehydrogenase